MHVISFLTATELLAFSWTAHRHRDSAIVLSRTFAVLDVEYAARFDRLQTLCEEFASLVKLGGPKLVGNPPVTKIARQRQVRTECRMLTGEMDNLLDAWDDKLKIWQTAGITRTAPLVSRSDNYRELLAP